MAKILNLKPDFTLLKLSNPAYKEELRKALFYANYEMESKKLKTFVLAWIKKQPEYDYKAISSLPDYRFDSVGKFCYFLVSGGELDEKTMTSLAKAVKDLERIYLEKRQSAFVNEDPTNEQKVEAKAEEKKTANIQDYLRERAAEVCSDIDGMIDDFITKPKDFDAKNFDIKKHFLNSKLKAAHYRHIPKFYERDIAELKEVLGGKSEQLNEGYGYLTKPQIKKLLSIYEEVLTIAEHLKVSAMPTKAPRKKKAVDIAKLVAKLKFKEIDSDLTITSVRPHNVLSAKELWVYNTKTKKLGLYLAADDAVGLTIKGTSIKGFSDKSVEKSVRKAKGLDIKKFTKTGKASKKKEFKDIVGLETKMNGRLNEHILLLSVEK